MLAAHLNRMPGSKQYPRTVGQHDQAVCPSIQCKHAGWQRFWRMLRQMASIDPRHLHRHDCQCRHEQDDTDPAQVRDPEQGSSYRAPGFVATQSDTQQQGCNGEADNAKQTGDPSKIVVTVARTANQAAGSTICDGLVVPGNGFVAAMFIQSSSDSATRTAFASHLLYVS